MSQAGQSTSANTVPPFPIVIKSGLIDFTSGGVQAIFTSMNDAFLCSTITVYITQLTGYVSDAVFNIGFTAPDYEDWIQASNTEVTVQGQYVINTLLEPIAPLPANTALNINITTPEVATTAKGFIYLQGTYA